MNMLLKDLDIFLIEINNGNNLAIPYRVLVNLMRHDLLIYLEDYCLWANNFANKKHTELVHKNNIEKYLIKKPNLIR